MEPREIESVLRTAPEIDLDAEPTVDQIGAAFPVLAPFDKGAVTVGRFSGTTPWERHLESDEFLHVLDGKVEITVLGDTTSKSVVVASGSIFVVPRGSWHRQVARPDVTILSLIPTDHGPVSFAEDPRAGA
jgi:quercetin dioxygenase-like cupin family protein